MSVIGRTIEAGHFYRFPQGDQTPAMSLEQVASIDIAAQLSDSETGLPLEYLLLVDDYHGHPKLDDAELDNERIHQDLASAPEVQSVIELFRARGIDPKIVSELQLTSAAGLLYTELRKRGVAKGQSLTRQFGNVTLTTYEGQPMCSLIDAAFYLRKIGQYKDQPTTTVLPEKYRSQQEEVKYILAALGVLNPPITVIYHDENGQVTLRDDWSKGILQ